MSYHHITKKIISSSQSVNRKGGKQLVWLLSTFLQTKRCQRTD